MTEQENQNIPSTTEAFTRSRRLTAAVALSLGVGSLVYGSVLAFPAAADASAGASCGSTVTATATKTDTGTATASPSSTASGTGTATASPTATATGTGTGTPSTTGSASPTGSSTATASESPTASATPTDCATDTATASASPTASKPHTTTASTPASSSTSKSATATATATAKATTTIAGKGGPTPGTGRIIPQIPVYALDATGSYFAYTVVPPGDASYQLPHGSITRAQIIARAQLWVQAQVPYSQTEWFTNQNGTYRQDCSGYVSMAWGLDQYTDFWTWNLNLVSHTIPAAELLPGDILLSNEHTILFAGWANSQHTAFDYYEEAHPGTVARYVVNAPLAAFLDNGFATFRDDGVVGAGTLPANPASGDLYATLAQQASEIQPPGVNTGRLLGLGEGGVVPTGTADATATQLSAQVAADDVVSTEGARSEGMALGVGGAFLVGAGLLVRRPVSLRGRRGKHKA